jgi:hypothetical protein
MVTFGSVASSRWPYSYLRAAKRPVNRRSSGTPYRHPRHAELTQVTARHPHLAAALWRETLIDGSIFREWIVNVGRRAALPRMAHLLIEVHERLEAIGRPAPTSLPEVACSPSMWRTSRLLAIGQSRPGACFALRYFWLHTGTRWLERPLIV